MEFHKETIPLPAEFPFDLYDAEPCSKLHPSLHFHDCLELNWIKSGSGVNIIEEREYPLRPGDIHIINNFERHMGLSDGDLCMQVLLFEPVFVLQGHPEDMAYLSPFFERNIHFSHCIPAENTVSPVFRTLLQEIQTEWERKEDGWQLSVRALLMRLLSLLYRHFRNLDEVGEDVLAFRKSYDRLRDVVSYLKEHYREPVGLDTLASVAHMNRTWLSTCFRNTMRTSIPAYVSVLRMQEACRRLKEETVPVTEIALSCGYSQVSHFNRAFRRHFGVSPTVWRSGRANPKPGQQDLNRGEAGAGGSPV